MHQIKPSYKYHTVLVFLVIITVFLYGLPFNGVSNRELNVGFYSNITENFLHICPDASLIANLSLVAFIKPNAFQMNRLISILLPSLAWFWLHPNSELILVTDPMESYEATLKRHAKTLLASNFKWNVFLTDKLKLDHGNTKKDERHKQIPKFWSDNFTNSEFIGIVDADTLFVTPVMASDLFVDGKPVMRGVFGCASHEWVPKWAENVKELLNLPFIGNFMVYFPVIVRRKDFANIRNFMVKQNKLKHFDQVFDNVKWEYSEFTLMAHYLWYFEHENYYWVMENSTMECVEMIPVTDQRVYQYAKRRLPLVSNHWPKVENNMQVNMETVLLNGICYADRSLWPDCLNWGIPIKNAAQSESIFYHQVNIFEWIFEREFWTDNDPETALQGHQGRMKLLEQCQFHWNYTKVAQLLKNYKTPQELARIK